MEMIYYLNAFSNDFSLTRAIFFNPLSFLGWGEQIPHRRWLMPVDEQL